jgi:MFS family permease
VRPRKRLDQRRIAVSRQSTHTRATGAAAGGIMPLTLAALGDAVPIRDRQVALSRLLVFGIGGQIAGGALAGLLAPALGWRGVLGLCGGSPRRRRRW